MISLNSTLRPSTVLVGAGPANLAVLSCFQDLFPDIVARTLLLERRSTPDWHPDFRFNGSKLQVSLLKDLAFTRDPTSQFTFWSFMHKNNYLDQFIHLNTFFPSRKLFSQYLDWVQAQFSNITHFNTEVIGIKPTPNGYRLSVRQGENRTDTEMVTQNLVLALGHEPYVPENLKCGKKSFHAIHFQREFDQYRDDKNLRVAIVGSGQTAGELVQNLMRMDNVKSVLNISRSHLFRQTDDNPFINDLYTFSGSCGQLNDNPNRRAALMKELGNSNYAVVTSDILQDIYQLNFEDTLSGRQRLQLKSHSEVRKVRDNNTSLELIVQDSLGDVTEHEVDMLIACTGFKNSRHLKLLEPLGLPLNDNGQLLVNQNYRVEGTDPRFGIFLVNHSTDTSLAEHTLGGLAGRAKLVCDELYEIESNQRHKVSSLTHLATEIA